MRVIHRPLLVVAATAPLAVLAGCNGGCKMSIVSDLLRVEVVDSVTGRPAANGAALVVARPGDTLRISTPHDESHFFVTVGAGHYSLTLTKPGARAWVREVELEERGCDIIGVNVTARLQPVP